jgi:hypothetical protein
VADTFSKREAEAEMEAAEVEAEVAEKYFHRWNSNLFLLVLSQSLY